MRRAGNISAVLLDWRGTLATTLSEQEWAAEALTRLGRSAETALSLAVALRSAEAALDAPGLDADAVLHRATCLRVFGELGLDGDLAESLYAVESDPALNRFADDAVPTLAALAAAGLRIAVVSDIHVDIRPAFTAAGLGAFVEVFTLSAEQGVQKPDPRMFSRTLEALQVPAERALMVGDRPGPDGGAVAAGIATLLLPSLTSPAERRLHLVPTACGLPQE